MRDSRTRKPMAQYIQYNTITYEAAKIFRSFANKNENQNITETKEITGLDKSKINKNTK